MRVKRTLLQLITISVYGIAPVFADSGVLGDIVKGSIDATGAVIGSAGKVVGHLIVVTPGTIREKTTIVSSGTPTKTIIMSDALSDTLCGRRAELERALAIASEQNRLSSEQVADLKAQLNAIIAADAAEKLKQSLTFDEAVSLAQRLDDYSTKVTTVTERQFSPLVIIDPGTHAQRIAATETIMREFQ